MTPAEEQASRANMIAIFEFVVAPTCLVASLVQGWLLSRTGAFTRARQLVAPIVASTLLMVPVMFAFGWILDRLPGGLLRTMYFSLRFVPPDLQFLYVVATPGVAAAVLAYTIVGRFALRRTLRVRKLEGLS